MLRILLGQVTPPEGIDLGQLIRADVNGDGCVDDADLLEVLLQFGASGGSADVNGDGIVDDSDLLAILLFFGICYLE